MVKENYISVSSGKDAYGDCMFIFSADGHIVEPPNLFTDGLPQSMRQYGLRVERRGEDMLTLAGEKIILRTRLNRPPPSVEVANFGGTNRRGVRELAGRLLDMESEGIDAEIVFPSMGLSTYLIENAEAELATTQIYNDWNNGFFGRNLDKFVRCAILPVRSFEHTVLEMKRVSKLGYTAAMLPSVVPAGVPNYNDGGWDSVFALAQELKMVFVLHTGTGREDVRSEKGLGGAVINYTIQMCDAQYSIMYMVGGGLLDRFPGTRIAVIESGASWLAALAERLDEVYEAHHMFVRPKLSIRPSEIIQRQVYASFQYDRACIMSRSVTGHQALLWGSDYPHNEGTFPRSREIVSHLFDGIDISDPEKADILGGNAARLFGFPIRQEGTA